MEKKQKEVMTVISKSTVLSEVRPTLQNWHPATKADAIKMLYFLSGIGATEDELKKKCYAMLSADGTQQNHYLAELDLTANPVTTSKHHYNETPETVKLEEEIKTLQAQLKVAREKAGINHSVLSTYYKIKEG